MAVALMLGMFVVFTASLAVAPERAAAYDSCIDSFDCYKLDVAANNSQPFTQHDLTLSPITTDDTGFTLQSGEHADCPYGNQGEHRWGDHSAWYRVDGGVAGTLDVSANTQVNGSQGFGVFMIVWEASHDDPIDYTNTSDLRNIDCSAAGPQVSLSGDAVFPNGPTFVQVLTDCGLATSSPCTGNETTGPIQLQFSFHCNDQDNDGVCDTVDQCPTVAANTTTGCPAPAQCPDSDGDGICNSSDPCPTVAGHAKDQPGCPDTDGDGIANDLDPCPTVAGNAKDEPGCPDSDHDGIADNLDGCPHSAGHSKALPGCPDSDGDGLPDKEDACPHQRGSVLLDGCPDSDHDGVANPKDRCPHTYARLGFSTYGNGRLGCPEPLAGAIDLLWDDIGRGSTDLTKVASATIPSGTRFIVQCAGVRCPRGTLLNIVDKAKKINLLPRLASTALGHGHGIRISVGEHLIIIARFKGTDGLSQTFVPYANKQPAVIYSCATRTGAAKVMRCPS